MVLLESVLGTAIINQWGSRVALNQCKLSSIIYLLFHPLDKNSLIIYLLFLPLDKDSLSCLVYYLRQKRMMVF